MTEPDSPDEDPPQGEPRGQQTENGSSLLVSGGLALFSAYVFVSSFFIPAPEGWQTAPGMLPMFLGGTLLIMALIISSDAIRNGAWTSLKESFSRQRSQGASERPIWRMVLAASLVATFYFGLLQFLYFEVAAFLFLFAMMQAFWTGSKFWHRLLTAALLPLAISTCFQGFFGIPLPGESSIVQDVLFWWKQKGS